MLSIFSGTFGCGYVLFEKISIQVFCPLKKSLLLLLVNYMNSLYILGIKPLSEIWLADILSHSVGCLLTLLVASSALQRSFSLL